MIVPELKPCPFCGGMKFRFSDKSKYYELLVEHGIACISMSCEKCKLDMYEHTDSIRNYDKKLEKLIKKWNSRANDENA